MDENEVKSLIEEEKNKVQASTSELKIEPPSIKYEIDKNKSYGEQAKDLVDVLATQKAVQDEELVNDITDKKKEELKESATANLKSEQANNEKAEQTLSQARYGTYEGVATYAGIKKALPQKMQNILFFILSIFQTFVLILFGVPTSIITIIIDCFDGIVAKLSSVAKSARWLFFGALAVMLVVLVILILKRFVFTA
ncbi:MAG: hypothetical protein KBS91_03935 [Firmicutes bacterium]|nr:hypothetical protein [Candidatus Caballimonas caccae]